MQRRGVVLIAGALFALLLCAHPAAAFAETVDVYEPDDTPATAKPIAAGEYQARIYAGGYDYIRIDAIAGHAYRVDVALLEQGAYEYLTPVLLDSAQTVLAFDSVTYPWPRALEFVASADSAYYVRIDGSWLGGDSRQYSIRLTDVPHSTVEGTVRDMGTDDPLGGMKVELYLHPNDSGSLPTLLESKLTDGSGHYSFQIDWPSQYIVRFSDPSGQRVFEYYGGRVSHYAATRINVQAGETYVADGSLGRPWSIDAVVRDAATGEPVPGARVTTFQDPAELAAIWTKEAVADGSGRVTIGGLDPHFPSRIRLIDQSGLRREQWVGAALDRLDALDVYASAGTTRTADIIMYTGGTIAGQVTEEGSGTSIQNAAIEVWRLVAGSWKQILSVSANQSGVFSAKRLVPGLYRVQAADPAGTHRTEWWNDAFSAQAGQDVLVSDDATSVVDVALSGDVRPPVTTAYYPVQWVQGPVTVELTATDDLSGVDRIEYELPGDSAPRLYGGPFVLESPGLTRVRYWATDAVSNVETPREAAVRIDNQGPGTIHDAVESYEQSATIRMAAGDALSGVASIYSALDGAAPTAEPMTLATRTIATAGSHRLDFWSVDNAGNLSAPTTLRFLVSWPTTSTVDTRSTVISAGATLTLRGHVSSGGSACGGLSVRLEESTDGRSFRDTGARRVTDASGRFAFAVRPSSKRFYRMSFTGATGLRSSRTGVVAITPKARLSRPSAPISVLRRQRFTVRGYLSPRHRSGAYVVKLYCYRLEGKTWVLRSSKRVRVSNSGSASKYSARLALPSRGSWRIRAYHADSGHASSWSSVRSIKVR